MDILNEVTAELKTIYDNLEKLTPMEVSNHTVRLSSMMATLGEALADKEMEYYKIWEKIRDNVETDGRAEKKAHATSEYHTKRIYELKLKAISEMIKSLKKRLQVLESESRGIY